VEFELNSHLAMKRRDSMAKDQMEMREKEEVEEMEKSQVLWEKKGTTDHQGNQNSE